MVGCGKFLTFSVILWLFGLNWVRVICFWIEYTCLLRHNTTFVLLSRLSPSIVIPCKYFIRNDVAFFVVVNFYSVFTFTRSSFFVLLFTRTVPFLSILIVYASAIHSVGKSTTYHKFLLNYLAWSLTIIKKKAFLSIEAFTILLIICYNLGSFNYN